MRRSTVGLHLLTALAIATPSAVVAAQGTQASAVDDRWTREELENLLAPIALYPDPILAQVLVAATYPDQVLAAQAHVRAFGVDEIDAMPWEISVKAVARYEPVLNLMAEGEDWMTALGQAYATQPVDVMNAVQSLRQMANAQGNLQTTAQQQVIVEREVIRIEPAEPRVVYVPVYDPAVVYFRPIYVAHAHPAYWSWGLGYPVGVWLTYDFDWWGHRIYYHGWHVAGPRWVVMSRPWIVMNPIYIAPRHTVVVVNRNVVHRRWSAAPVRRYSQIHRNVTFERHDRWGGRRDVGRGWGSVPADRGRAVPERDAPGNRGGVANGGGRNNGGGAANGGGRGNGGGNAGGNNGRRVGPPSDDQRGGGGRRVGPRDDVPNQRVTPLPSGGATRVARNDAAATPTPTRAATPSGQTTRSSNGTWNPRSTGERAAADRAATPRANAAPRAASPQSSASRGNDGSWNARPAPQASAPSTPRASTSAPRASTSAPRANTPRASAPSSSSAPRASAPRASSGSAPRAAAPRSSGGGGSAPRASAPRSSGGGGAARGSSGSGGRGRPN
ncbi:MAG: DUF3300 domain-containing protein [Gemmatimonadaceae bacterium]|nr:DUF3300 domain-containing protein [Gemmatimonadaceae bacterium]MCW5826163.1 DUF3300 domain-containing protein [Gemmatimonadaceae bacterium]